MNLFYDVNEEGKKLSGFISDIMDDKSCLQSIASNSYSHVLGFDKIVLKKNPSGDKLSLHIWWPGSTYIDDDIHHHRWNFSSLILAGKMEVSKYGNDPNGELYHRYKHTSPQEAEYYQLTKCGMDRVSIKEILNVGVGDQYSHEYFDLHHVVRKRDFVVTLFSQSPAIIDYSYILTKIPLEEKLMKVDAKRVPIDYLESCLSTLQDRLFSNQYSK